MNVQPYLHFNGCAEEAIEFYKKALGAKPGMLMRFDESPERHPDMPPGTEKKIMHAEITVGDSLLMISDGMCTGDWKFEGISLTLQVETTAEAEKRFAALGEGGKVQMPLTETFFSPRFGMVDDRFGVSWLVIVPKK